MREKQAGEAWVAGSVGPLGVRLEPLGKTGLDEARAAFAEQIRALADGGRGPADHRNHARARMKPAKRCWPRTRRAPHLPVLVMVTVDDDSNCLDGSSPAAGRRPADGVGRGRDRRQLLHRPGDRAHRH